MAKKLGSLLVGMVMISTLAVEAQATVINFDDVSDGTTINTQYGTLGVNFSAVSTQNGSENVYAREGGTLANSPSNVVSLFQTGIPAFDRRWGGIKATFSSAVNEASIDARALLPPEYLGSLDSKPFFQAFDSNGAYLETVYYSFDYGDTGFGTWETLKISRSTSDIASVIFSSQHNDGQAPVYGLFDNLAFGSGTSGPENPPVPEPTTILLLGSGLAGMALRKIRKKAE